jgi:hypothetical protein
LSRPSISRIGRRKDRAKASLRRAVSTAYYALFHLLIHEARFWPSAFCLLPSAFCLLPSAVLSKAGAGFATRTSDHPTSPTIRRFQINNLQKPTTSFASPSCYFIGMSASPTFELHYTDRAAINRANSEHSTGPRTDAGKQRSSLNALSHGLTARTAVLPTEDPSAYQQHCRQLFDEYQPATATETQLVQELADTAWRLNRIPILEASLIAEVPSPQSLVPQLAALGLHGARLSRQFEKTLAQLREIQFERRERQRRDLRDAAILLEFHRHKGIPWDPADSGFVFSKDQVERAAQRIMRLQESRTIEYFRFGSYSNPLNAPSPSTTTPGLAGL